MVERIWHGYTSLENALKYEQLLKKVIFPGIKNKKIPGFRGIKLLKRVMETEVEFVTIMRFDKLENIVAFTGKEYKIAYVPDEARRILKNYDKVAQHYSVLIE